jgi:hypothetical protein
MQRIFYSAIFILISLTGFSQQSCFSRLKNYSVPQYFETGSMGGFYTLAEINRQLDSMHLLYPNLITLKSNIDTFHTIEGRPMYWIEITNLQDSANHKPQVLFTALHHAMEPMGMQQLIFFMDYLLENYGTNPEITYLVNNLEIYFIPVVNPDGYEYNYSTNPSGGGTWRKNRRDNGFTTGVDLNRNYGIAWGYDEIGSSSLGWHPWYRGDSAFSEPETQAIKYFQEHHNFKSAINWHSWGNYLIYPWNYKNYYTADSTTYESFCKMMAYESNYVYGTVYEAYGYQSNGDADDWAYAETTHKHSILSLTAESGNSSDGFWPSPNSRIIELCKEALPVDLTFLQLNLHYAKIHDLTSSVLSSSSGYLQYEVQNIGLDTPSTFIIHFTSLTPGFTINAVPKLYTSMQKLQEVNDSISYNSSILNSSQLKYLVSVDNGSYTYTDTVVKYFAPGSLYFSSNCSSMNHFTGSDWGLDTTQYYSSPSSITESPYGNYSLLQQSELTVDTLIDLTNAQYATVNFHAKWNLENNYDYNRLLISTDNGSTWAPLCGRYSEIGSSSSITTEPTGEPVWDAIQKDWILEDIPLTDYLGQIAQLKFSFYSDQSNTRDGFYFDDFKIYVIQNPISNIADIATNNAIKIWPNPVNDFIFIKSEKNEVLTFNITDMYGNGIQQGSFSSNEMINLKYLSAGFYLITVSGTNRIIREKFFKN